MAELPSELVLTTSPPTTCFGSRVSSRTPAVLISSRLTASGSRVRRFNSVPSIFETEAGSVFFVGFAGDDIRPRICKPTAMRIKTAQNETCFISVSMLALELRRGHVRFVRQQQFYRVALIKCRCPVQGREPVLIQRVHIRLPGQKQLDHLVLTVKRRPMQSRSAVTVPGAGQFRVLL